jgi:hypothetical protein
VQLLARARDDDIFLEPRHARGAADEFDKAVVA